MLLKDLDPFELDAELRCAGAAAVRTTAAQEVTASSGWGVADKPPLRACIHFLLYYFLEM